MLWNERKQKQEQAHNEEKIIARKLENAVATLKSVKHIYTSVSDGAVTVTVEFRLEKPTQEAVDDVRDAVATRVHEVLPPPSPIISRTKTAPSKGNLSLSSTHPS